MPTTIEPPADAQAAARAEYAAARAEYAAAIEARRAQEAWWAGVRRQTPEATARDMGVPLREVHRGGVLQNYLVLKLREHESALARLEATVAAARARFVAARRAAAID